MPLSEIFLGVKGGRRLSPLWANCIEYLGTSTSQNPIGQWFSNVVRPRLGNFFWRGPGGWETLLWAASTACYRDIFAFIVRRRRIYRLRAERTEAEEEISLWHPHLLLLVRNGKNTSNCEYILYYMYVYCFIINYGS
jgi:hypothetical protein